MKRQYRLYSNVAILCAAAAASFWLLLPDAAARCASGGGRWHASAGYCIRPDCRQRQNCGEKAAVSHEECLSVRPGDSLDKAWFVLGEPQQSESGRFLWQSKGSGGEPARISADGERVGSIVCAP